MTLKLLDVKQFPLVVVLLLPLTIHTIGGRDQVTASPAQLQPISAVASQPMQTQQQSALPATAPSPDSQPLANGAAASHNGPSWRWPAWAAADDASCTAQACVGASGAFILHNA